MGTAIATRPEVTTARSRVRSTAGLLVGLVVLGASIRLWALGANRLGYDEAFTAMVGRLPLGDVFPYLRAHDSHPPLDYLLHLPLARLGVNAWWFRLPGVLCSIGALGLFAWWMRNRGRAGVLATALMALSAFQVVHGRDARMYAELELLGVALAVLAESWLRVPRRRHAWILGALVAIGLLTHVSMFLLGAGLFALAGRRTDREAWRWRGAIVAAGAVWAALWGSSFLVQSAGGHSDWIPRTTPAGVIDTVAGLVTNTSVAALAISAGVAAGSVLVWRRDPRLGAVWCACFAIPLGLAAVAGFAAPVLLTRTLTLSAWAPLLAIGVLLDAILARARLVGVVALLVLGVLVVPPTFTAVSASSGADRALRRLEAVIRPGDVVAVRSADKAPELLWTLGVRGPDPWRAVTVAGIAPKVAGLALGGAAVTGRVWVLDWDSRVRYADGYSRCAPDQNFGVSRILCLRRDGATTIEDEHRAVEAQDGLALVRHTTSSGHSA